MSAFFQLWGRELASYFRTSIAYVVGAVFLAIVAGFPIILGNITGTSIQLGGTTLLIVVGVALETGRSLEGYMTARYHKGFLE